MKQGLDQSLFVRLQHAQHVHMLTVQYRMHPAISAFPSMYFYEGKLVDAPVVLQGGRDAPFHRCVRVCVWMCEGVDV